MHTDQCVQSRSQVIHHDSEPFRQPLQLTHRRRLQDIEDTKKYKAGKKAFPAEGNSDQRDQLSGNLINYDKLRIFHS